MDTGLNENQNKDALEPIKNEIQLYIYDLSRGYAQSLLSQLLGKEIPGIWHTSIVVYGREYFFGTNGIESCDPGNTFLGEPQQIIQLGVSEISYSLFLEYIFGLGSSTFAVGTYDLFTHNCNNFTNELANFFFGKGIPKEILELPNEIMKTPLGNVLAGFLSSFNIRPEGQGAQLSGSIHQSKNLYLLQKSQDNSNKKQIEINNQRMAESSSSNVISANEGIENPIPQTKKKANKYSDPPYLFQDVNAPEIVKKLKELIYDKLEKEEKLIFNEWYDFILNVNDGWSLGDEHIILFRKILDNSNNLFPEESIKLLLQVLQFAALNNEFILLLHQDRKEHRLMSYLNKIEKLELNLQEEICKLVINLCNLPSSLDWLMYISEWFDQDNTPSSNSRVTTRIAVHCLLHEKLKRLQTLGLKLIWNLALREVFEETAMELATALFQFLHNDLNEEDAFIALTSLYRFILISPNDITMLGKMLAPNIDKFKSISTKNDELVNIIKSKLNI